MNFVWIFPNFYNFCCIGWIYHDHPFNLQRDHICPFNIVISVEIRRHEAQNDKTEPLLRGASFLCERESKTIFSNPFFLKTILHTHIDVVPSYKRQYMVQKWSYYLPLCTHKIVFLCRLQINMFFHKFYKYIKYIHIYQWIVFSNFLIHLSRFSK